MQKKYYLGIELPGFNCIARSHIGGGTTITLKNKGEYRQFNFSSINTKKAGSVVT